MAASIAGILVVLLILLVFGYLSTNRDDLALTYGVVGCIVGILGVALTAGCVLLFSKRHSTKKILALGDENATTVVKNTATNNYVTNPKSGVSPNATGGHISQQRRPSVSSDYTESHYYTEIDEYFINKRIGKQQQKLQKRSELMRPDNSKSENSNLENSTHIYDYAYGKAPQS